jgi:hypothetical protein
MLENASDAFALGFRSPVDCLTLSLRVPHRGLTCREDDSARTMQRFARFALIVAVGLAVAGPAGAAQVESSQVPGSEAVELRRGIGYAALWDRGAVLGRVALGRVRVINLRGAGPPSGWVRGCERRRGRLVGTLYCQGSNLRFWIHGGTWKVQLRGRGINASGVVRGTLALDRAPQGRGVYRIGDEDVDNPFRRWPKDLTFYSLRA